MCHLSRNTRHEKKNQHLKNFQNSSKIYSINSIVSNKFKTPLYIINQFTTHIYIVYSKQLLLTQKKQHNITIIQNKSNQMRI